MKDFSVFAIYGPDGQAGGARRYEVTLETRRAVDEYNEYYGVNQKIGDVVNFTPSRFAQFREFADIAGLSVEFD